MCVGFVSSIAQDRFHVLDGRRSLRPLPRLFRTCSSFLNPEYDAWDVLGAWYADHLSDAALEWLVSNKVIKREQRYDAVAIPRSISDWLEQLERDGKAGRLVVVGTGAGFGSG
jgi:hypothetical protein